MCKQCRHCNCCCHHRADAVAVVVAVDFSTQGSCYSNCRPLSKLLIMITTTICSADRNLLSTSANQANESSAYKLSHKVSHQILHCTFDSDLRKSSRRTNKSSKENGYSATAIDDSISYSLLDNNFQECTLAQQSRRQTTTSPTNQQPRDARFVIYGKMAIVANYQKKLGYKTN